MMFLCEPCCDVVQTYQAVLIHITVYLPAQVHTYMSPQHLPTQTAEVALADLVSVPIALGYRHVVFAHTQPGKQAARPSGNVFENARLLLFFLLYLHSLPPACQTIRCVRCVVRSS